MLCKDFRLQKLQEQTLSISPSQALMQVKETRPTFQQLKTRKLFKVNLEKTVKDENLSFLAFEKWIF